MGRTLTNKSHLLFLVWFILICIEEAKSQFIQDMDRRGIAYRNFMMNPPLLSNGMAPLQLAQGASLSPTYRPAALTFQKFKRKYGILKTFMKRRPRLFWTFIKRDDDDEDVTWRDYVENSVDWPECQSFVSSFDISSRMIKDQVLRSWLVGQMCQEFLFGVLVPFMSEMAGIDDEEMNFENSEI